MRNYYNENDKFAAQWLRNLIAEGLIAPGDVDDRSICDVQGKDLEGYAQCHFFAGIGGWSYALRLAGWPDDWSAWTASLPCQPWSIANVGDGGRAGHHDNRHLWPHFFGLARERRPDALFGEQVPGAIALGWLDGVFGDLEGEGYACGAVVAPACAIGARHQRDRILWMAHPRGAGRQGCEPIQRLPVATAASFPVNGDPLARAWRAMDGDFDGLLHCDGLSVVMERHAIKGYGNAIVPQVAAEFIRAALIED